MSNAVELAIKAYTEKRDASEPADDEFKALDLAILQSTFFVPVYQQVTKIREHAYSIPLVCIKTLAGDGAIPIFTTLDHLQCWKEEGSDYVELTGKAILTMALGMPDISIVVVNVDSSPRGAIPRTEFERLIALADE